MQTRLLSKMFPNEGEGALRRANRTGQTKHSIAALLSDKKPFIISWLQKYKTLTSPPTCFNGVVELLLNCYICVAMK